MYFARKMHTGLTCQSVNPSIPSVPVLGRRALRRKKSFAPRELEEKEKKKFHCVHGVDKRLLACTFLYRSRLQVQVRSMYTVYARGHTRAERHTQKTSSSRRDQAYHLSCMPSNLPVRAFHVVCSNNEASQTKPGGGSVSDECT
jgi:hypothetical protein